MTSSKQLINIFIQNFFKLYEDIGTFENYKNVSEKMKKFFYDLGEV